MVITWQHSCIGKSIVISVSYHINLGIPCIDIFHQITLTGVMVPKYTIK